MASAVLLTSTVLAQSASLTLYCSADEAALSMAVLPRRALVAALPHSLPRLKER